MPEMKKCKECGKMFMPKGREQYCSDIHYRPCPVCGKPTEVKYFSDPPRKCDNCKGRRSPVPKIKEEQKVDVPKNPMKPKSLFNFEPKSSWKSIDPSNTKKETRNDLTRVIPATERELEWKKRIETKIPDTVDQLVFCEMMTGAIRMYIGNPYKNGFIPGHEYLLKVERDEYCYLVSSVEDLTANESCNILIPYASQISFHQNFRMVKKEKADGK